MRVRDFSIRVSERPESLAGIRQWTVNNLAFIVGRLIADAHLEMKSASEIYIALDEKYRGGETALRGKTMIVCPAFDHARLDPDDEPATQAYVLDCVRRAFARLVEMDELSAEDVERLIQGVEASGLELDEPVSAKWSDDLGRRRPISLVLRSRFDCVELFAVARQGGARLPLLRTRPAMELAKGNVRAAAFHAEGSLALVLADPGEHHLGTRIMGHSYYDLRHAAVEPVQSRLDERRLEFVFALGPLLSHSHPTTT